MGIDLRQIDLNSSQYSGVYIGGGNTFKLLKIFKETRFDVSLKKFLENGGTVYGGSAGAIILGKDIMTCAHLDENQVGLKDFSGLNLINEYSIWCHYESGNDELIDKYIGSRQIPVIAIPEKSGILLNGESIEVIGQEPCYQFEKGSKKMLK